ncbi:hypothetical protein E9993_22110 [Labilibacter sediminis]|nr:hypothetical protein E9993_22110 [Labilibacter sediminis]
MIELNIWGIPEDFDSDYKFFTKKNIKFTIEDTAAIAVDLVSMLDLESGYKVELDEGSYTLTLESDEVFYKENFEVTANTNDIEIHLYKRK